MKLGLNRLACNEVSSKLELLTLPGLVTRAGKEERRRGDSLMVQLWKYNMITVITTVIQSLFYRHRGQRDSRSYTGTLRYSDSGTGTLSHRGVSGAVTYSDKKTEARN